MEEFKSKVIKLAISGVMIFAIGIFVGYQLNYGTLASIQGYLFNAAGEATDANATDSNATDSNATDANATDANATDANATDSNATDANATDANASITDNIIFLHSFKLERNSVKPGEKIFVEIDTSGACNTGASVVFKNPNGVTFTVQVQDITGSSYITIPKSALASTYVVSDVLLVGLNSDNTTFTKQYSLTGSNVFNFNSFLTVTAKDKNDVGNNNSGNSNSGNNNSGNNNSGSNNSGSNNSGSNNSGSNNSGNNNTGNNNSENNNKENNNSGNNNDTQTVSKVTLNSITLDNSTAKVNEKVYINIKTSEKLNSLKLVFSSTDGTTFTVYGKDLSSSKPYIEIPSSTISGTYSLVSAIISTLDSSTIYSKTGEKGTEKFNFNITIKISDGAENVYIYNNEDINSEILAKLYSAPSGSEFTVNADSNTLINSELFNVIKGKNKKLIVNYKDNQIIFNGKDIDNSKTIDISMTVENIINNENISKLVSKGILVNFPDNGNLPGKALIRVKATDEVMQILKNKVYVYVYNNSSNNFSVIDTNVKKSSDNYYEFTITHNSDYIIVNEKLESKLVVSKSSENVVNFQKGNKTLLMLIAIGGAIIIAAVIVIIVLKKKQNIAGEKINK